MGYPVVTRLGINQFWIKHWYAENNTPENIQHDKIFEKLLLLYINYGLSTPQNIFFHDYFFSKLYYRFKFNNLERQSKYFRSFFYSNTVLTIEHSYLIRNRASEYFPMRLWHLKYNSWVLLAFNCFRPLKQKQRTRLLTKKKGVSAFAASLTRSRHYTFLNRFKLLYLYMRKHAKNSLSYNF